MRLIPRGCPSNIAELCVNVPARIVDPADVPVHDFSFKEVLIAARTPFLDLLQASFSSLNPVCCLANPSDSALGTRRQSGRDDF